MNEFENFNNDNELRREIQELENQLAELKKLRNKLSGNEIEENTNTEEVVEDTDLRNIVEKELEEIDKEIEEIEEEIKKAAKEYEQSYKNLGTMIDDYDKTVDSNNLLSEEEYDELRKRHEQEKLAENELSNTIKKRLDDQKKIVRDLKRKKNQLKNNLTKAEALGLTYDEYKEITSTIRKTSIMNSILESKGLGTIIEKNASERTKEENDLLKKTKEEILKEISEFKADSEYDDYSILDIIEALYSLENTYTEVKIPREIKIKKNELMVIDENKQILPFKVVNQNAKPITNVEEAPKDMEGAEVNDKVDINDLKPAEEKVTLFKDSDTSDYYVRKYAVDRFKLKSADLGNEVRINGSLCYKISESDVEKIKENANNSFSPYIADIKEITLENKKNNEILLEEVKDELIPGTKIKRPRDRKPYETDKEYEEFLKSYYDRVFPREEEKEDEHFIANNEALNDIELPKVEPIMPNTEEKALRVIPQEKEPEVKEELEDEPIEIEINPNDGITINVDDEELTDDDISSVISENLEEEKEELTDEEISSVINESLEETTEVKVEKVEDKPKDKLEATNIKASEEFKQELRDGGILYNILHSLPKGVKRVIRGVVKAYNNYLFGSEMAAKIDQVEREVLGRRHFYDEDDEIDTMMREMTPEEEAAADPRRR